ncbi:FeoA domain-containing protein [Roseibium sp.]|uniref:FeoA domain-containing protein n=1 Tax=Roseibium sp. TaxID=1936156 RepID=UPI003D0AEB6B
MSEIVCEFVQAQPASAPNVPEGFAGDDTLTLAHAEPGGSYHVTSLGETRHARLEVLSTGLAPEAVINLLRGKGNRPRIVACGEIRAAIGVDLASGVRLRPCSCGCGCDTRQENE